MVCQPKTAIPMVGVAFRPEASETIVEHLHEFEVLEVMVDHYIAGGPRMREQIHQLSREVPIVGHGVGLSLGTAVPPDPRYLDEVARVLELMSARSHSEHLAFTKVPGRDFSQLLPLPRIMSAAECVLENIASVRRHIGIPFGVENITYYYEYSESSFSELEFLKLICRESGAFLLLDLENVYLNSCNLDYDPVAFIDAIPPGLVKAVHVAGGTTLGDLMLDSHDQPIPERVLALLRHLLSIQAPETIILERDDRLDCFNEILADVRRTKAAVASLIDSEVK
jgi:uncharacterized protein (UPF0276 family)